MLSHKVTKKASFSSTCCRRARVSLRRYGTRDVNVELEEFSEGGAWPPGDNSWFWDTRKVVPALTGDAKQSITEKTESRASAVASGQGWVLWLYIVASMVVCCWQGECVVGGSVMNRGFVAIAQGLIAHRATSHFSLFVRKCRVLPRAGNVVFSTS